MKRQELAEFVQRESKGQARGLAIAVVLFLAWIAGLFLLGSRLDWRGAGARSAVLIFAYVAVPLIVVLTMVVSKFRRMPKCPHCGVRLVSWLLATAVASGNCGRCGRSIES